MIHVYFAYLTFSLCHDIKGRIICLVDDDTEDRLLIREALQFYADDLCFFEAKNGVEIVEKLKSAVSCPSLILLDMNMSLMNGLETIVTLKAFSHLKDVTIVMLSTSSDPRLAELALTSGIDKFVVKPTNYNKLQLLAKELILDYL